MDKVTIIGSGLSGPLLAILLSQHGYKIELYEKMHDPRKSDLSAGKLAKYERLWKSEFPPYHKILRGKTALYNLSDKELSIMGRCLPNEMGNMGAFTKLAVGLKILFRKPTLLAKRVISVLLSFGYSRAKYYGW